MDAALEHLRGQGAVILPDDLARVSPLEHQNIVSSVITHSRLQNLLREEILDRSETLLTSMNSERWLWRKFSSR